MLPNPKTVKDSDFRDKLEAIVDLLKCATNGTTYPPGRDQFSSDEKRPDPIYAVTNFSNDFMKAIVLRQDSLFTSYADEARNRPYDPAWRRLADDIDDLVRKLADKLRFNVEEITLDNMLKPRDP